VTPRDLTRDQPRLLDSPIRARNCRCWKRPTAGATQPSPPTPPPASSPSWRLGTAPHACVEDRINAAKDTGLGRFPSREFKINETWLQLVAIAADLTAGSGCSPSPVTRPPPQERQTARLKINSDADQTLS
jgi:hypothetical protein